MRWTLIVSSFASLLLIGGAIAQSGKRAVPVFEGDSDRPYRIIGPIRDNLRKHFAFQANPTKEKIHAELWERGRKMGADAVINARFGPTEATPFNHGSTPIWGTAIKYIDN